MHDETKTPVCPNAKCSHYMLRVSLVEARRNRCGICFSPLDGDSKNVGQLGAKVAEQLPLNFRPTVH